MALSVPTTYEEMQALQTCPQGVHRNDCQCRTISTKWWYRQLGPNLWGAYKGNHARLRAENKEELLTWFINRRIEAAYEPMISN